MATGATEFVDKTISDGVFSPDIWSKAVLRATESNLVIAKAVNREFQTRDRIPQTTRLLGRLAGKDCNPWPVLSFQVINNLHC